MFENNVRLTTVILHEFAASIQTSQHTYRKEKIAPFP